MGKVQDKYPKVKCSNLAHGIVCGIVCGDWNDCWESSVGETK